jgi:hypothetical protein
MAERTKWSDERVDDLADHLDVRLDGIDRRFDETRHEVNHRFDRVEGDLEELRQMVTYLGGSMLIGFLVIIATVLLGGR